MHNYVVIFRYVTIEEKTTTLTKDIYYKKPDTQQYCYSFISASLHTQNELNCSSCKTCI